jgi:hypothetical protein
VRHIKFFLQGMIALSCGVFLGTLAAYLPEQAPAQTFPPLLIESQAPATAPHVNALRVESAQISGTILDKEGAPIVGATVSISEKDHTRTDLFGRFLFTNVSPGLVQVRVEHPEYFLFQSEPLQVIAGEDIEETFVLPKPRLVSVYISNQRKAPLAEIEIAAPEQSPIFTDLAGLAVMKLPTDQVASARVKVAGFQPMLLVFSTEGELSLTIPRPASLIARLSNAPEKTDLLLLPMSEGALTSSPVLVSAEQSFQTQGLLPGRYQVWARSRGEAWFLQEVNLTTGENYAEIAFVAHPEFTKESCEDGFAPLSSVTHQDGVLLVQKGERELLAGDRIVAIDGVPLHSEETFSASWVGARGSIARLTIERPAQKRFIFASVPRSVFVSCSSD